ncbi:hypothetical protein ANN_08033 [Periplaneta americana]|uniref:DUF4817 domain-containing protein n=1 Tax=Periplaneta americana TaxID=6978 RepID=A0ABQ8T0C2_PERAM|nr:hypothetical protein ANN_08033 [Periplaneta americana]
MRPMLLVAKHRIPMPGVPYDELRRRFQRKVRKDGPTNKSIWRLLNKFQRTGNVADDSRTGRPSTSPADIDTIREFIYLFILLIIVT